MSDIIGPKKSLLKFKSNGLKPQHNISNINNTNITKKNN